MGGGGFLVVKYIQTADDNKGLEFRCPEWSDTETHPAKWKSNENATRCLLTCVSRQQNDCSYNAYQPGDSIIHAFRALTR